MAAQFLTIRKIIYSGDGAGKPLRSLAGGGRIVSPATNVRPA